MIHRSDSSLFLYIQVFGAKMAKVESLDTVSLRSLWSTRKQVIIIFPQEDIDLLRDHIFSTLIWPDTILTSREAKIQQVCNSDKFLKLFFMNIHTTLVIAKDIYSRIQYMQLSIQLSLLLNVRSWFLCLNAINQFYANIQYAITLYS